MTGLSEENHRLLERTIDVEGQPGTGIHLATADLNRLLNAARDQGRAEARVPSVEEVARVIEPDAWAYFDTDAGQHYTRDLLRFSDWKQSSIRKAKQVLALLHPAKAQPDG